MRTDHARGVSWRSTPCVAERWLRVGVENRANIKPASKTIAVTIAAKSCERFVCVIVASRAGQELCACVAFRGLDLFESVGCERHVLHGAASPCTALRRWRCRAWRGRHFFDCGWALFDSAFSRPPKSSRLAGCALDSASIAAWSGILMRCPGAPCFW